MAHIIKVIKLSDGSTFESKEMAIRYLENKFAKDVSNPAQEMANEKAFFIKDYIFENLEKFEKLIALLKEIKTIKELNL